MGTTQLARAKKQLTGQIAISAENNENQMLSIGKSQLVYNKVDDLKTVCKKIDEITAQQILEVANDILTPEKLSTLIYL
jgi:predicted Zn-dependent peptidase